MKKRLLITATVLLTVASAFSRSKPGFAIVVDAESRRQVAAELADYARAIEEVQGYRVYTVTDRWGVPDSLRQELQRLHSLRHSPIVGAVFVGDIPVPMVRDAQFLTSAFKMSQQQPWPDSSVPSDRFYDDFSLTFRFLKRDSLKPHLFYYTLTYEGSQRLHPDLFTGRIRPTDAGGTSRYEKLRRYLRKATDAKRRQEPLQSVLVYTGSGSLNESRPAHIDEQQALSEHFPQLADRPGAFSYMDYGDEPFIKRKLMNELMRADLSIALLHHHGDYDTQYLSSRPHLKALDGVPDSVVKDSMNLTLKDFANYGYRPNCRVVLYDACYNAAFQNDDCIANEYIFQPGMTVAGIGGTVNVLQDKWPDRYMGLLAHGLTVGQLCQLCPELEMHVVGDPTFTFRPEKSRGPTADEQCLRLLQKGRRLSDAQLLQTLRTSPFRLVRTQAFMLLQQRNSDHLVEAIEVAAADNFELLQRFAVNAIQKCGDPRLAPVLAQLIARNNTSARVAFNAKEVVQFLPKEAITAAVTHALDSMRPYVTWPDEYVGTRQEATARFAGRWAEEIGDLCAGKMTAKRALRQADFMKIYLAPWLAEDVARYTASLTGNDELQIALLWALGWHRLGYKHKAVSDIIEQMTTDARLTEAVRHEAVRTLKRLSTED